MQNINPYIGLCLEGPLSIFKDLSQKEKESIAQHHTVHPVKKGDLLVKEGDKVRGIVFLASGKAKVFKVGVGGREQILKMVSQQECIGYGALLGQNTWFFSASAIEDSMICVLERQYIVRILKKNIEFSLKLNSILIHDLWQSYNRTVSLSQKHVRGRLVESLLMLADIYGYEEDGKTLIATLSREDIAHLSNMTTSNAIRALSSLASEGKIAIKGRKIIILEKDRLEQISLLG